MARDPFFSIFYFLSILVTLKTVKTNIVGLLYSTQCNPTLNIVSVRSFPGAGCICDLMGQNQSHIAIFSYGVKYTSIQGTPSVQTAYKNKSLKEKSKIHMK